MNARGVLVLGAFGLVAVAGPSQGQAALRPLPENAVSRLPASIELSRDDQRDLAAGEVLIEEIKSKVKHETVAFAMVKIDVTLAQFERLYLRPEILIESNQASLFGRLGAMPGQADFHDLEIIDKDLKDLPRCEVSKCKVKLDARWINRFVEDVDWKSSDSQESATALYRELLSDLARGYVRSGDVALLRANDKNATISIAEQVRGLLANAPSLTERYPELYEYLTGYPATSLSGIRSTLYWMRDDLGSQKPVTQIHHQVVYRPDWPGGEMVVASKQLYANHYFEAALGLTIMVPTPGDQSVYLLHVYRARIDALRGFGLFHGRLRSSVRKLVQRRVELTKRRLEAAVGDSG